MPERLPTPEELAKVSQAHETADPTTYSALPVEGRLTFDREATDKTGISTYNAESGEQYYALEHKPEMQQFVARLLKGVMNVSDVVRSTESSVSHPDLLSRKMPLERIEMPTSTQEARADNFILKYVFGDPDHTVYRNEVGNAAGQRAYYDFGGASNFFRMETGVYGTPESEAESYKDAAPDILRTLDALEAQVRGEEGRAFIAAIVENVGVPIGELFSPVPKSFREAPDQVAAFQEHLLAHIRAVRSAVAPYASAA